MRIKHLYWVSVKGRLLCLFIQFQKQSHQIKQLKSSLSCLFWSFHLRSYVHESSCCYPCVYTPIPYIALYKHRTWKSPTKRWLWCINSWSHNNICTFVLYLDYIILCCSFFHLLVNFVHFVENEKFFFIFARMKIYFLSLFFMI